MSLFVTPTALLLLAVLPALWVIVRQARRDHDAALDRFGRRSTLAKGSALPPLTPDRVRSICRWTALAALVVALARPQVGRHPAELPRTGRDLIVALDLSRSMKATDVGMTRLELAKRLAWQLAGTHPGDRVGLVIFAGAAFLQLPPTADLGTLQRFLDAATPDDIADPSTNLASALRVSERALRKERTLIGSRGVILLTDGERSEGPLDPIFDLYRRAHIPIFAVGIGTLDGAQVPNDSGDAEGPWHLDNIGRPVISRLAESDLQRLAQVSNGAYARWDDARGLEQMTQGIANLESRILNSQANTEPNERYQWPLLVAVVGLIIEMMFRVPGSGFRVGTGASGRRVNPGPVRPAGTRIPPTRHSALGTRNSLIALLATLTGLSCGDGGRADLVRGQQLYEQGKWLEAYEAYQRVLRQEGGPEVRYNAGNTLYRMRQYTEAAKSWREALNASPTQKQNALYNMGNAYVRAAQDANALSRYLDRAVEAYEEALRLDPTDKEAKWNLEVALRRRGDTDERGSRGQGGRADYGRSNSREEGYEANRQTAVGAMAGGGQGGDEGESVEELDEQQARAMLEEVERQQLNTHEGRRQQKGGSANRDW
ncbi:MAG TPA: VWA domain-containing protein [Gemmatimonadales bacterium]|nr:VWA domain-containing protein [Gemmatimonadales bacterium]